MRVAFDTCYDYESCECDCVCVLLMQMEQEESMYDALQMKQACLGVKRRVRVRVSVSDDDGNTYVWE